MLAGGSQFKFEPPHGADVHSLASDNDEPFLGSFGDVEHHKVGHFWHPITVNLTVTVSRHVLPASALSRVFFLSQEELFDYFTPAALPKGCFTLFLQFVRGIN